MLLRTESGTILFADVVESVRLVEHDERRAVERIQRFLRRVAAEHVPRHGGTVLERRGDGLLVRLGDPRDGAACAFALHEAAQLERDGEAPGEALSLRIGVHAASFLADEHGLYGSALNLAARIAGLAGPGETVASESVRDALVAGLDAAIDDLGDCFLKHVDGTVRAFRLRPPDGDASPPSSLAPVQARLPRLAVLAFRDGDGSTGPLGELLAETVVHSVSRTRRVDVIAWMSSRAFAGRELSAARIGQALGADWLLTGSCRPIGPRVLIHAELVRAAPGSTGRIERLVDDADDLLRSESAIGHRLASWAVNEIAAGEAVRVARHPLPTLESHALLSGAIGLMHRSGPADFARGREALEHLLERHPRMHAARPWLAKWYLLRTTRGLAADAPDAAPRALEQTGRALDARPDDAFALAIQGFVRYHLGRDLAGALDELERAVAMAPQEALAFAFSAAALGSAGRFDDAWQRAARALELSPYDPLRAYLRMIAATSAVLSGRPAEGALLAGESVRENGAHPAAWRTWAVALVLAGRVEEARRAASALLRLEPGFNLTEYRRRLTLPEPQAATIVAALRTAGAPSG